MLLTINDTEKNLEQLMSEQGYTITNPRTYKDGFVRMLISHVLTPDTQIYIHGAGVNKNNTPIDIKAEAAPMNYNESRTLVESRDRLQFILISAGTGQEVQLYIDTI